jgi:putative two-component system hydrogenase maturation factor HypX/HoxX
MLRQQKKILLFSSAYNSLTQRVQCELGLMKYDVKAAIVNNPEQMRDHVKSFGPNLILCPMLKTAVPDDVWKSTKTLILHPGIKGDRGPSSLDWCITKDMKEWGLTVLEADYEMDAGPIYDTVNFSFQRKRKTELYNKEVSTYGT